MKKFVAFAAGALALVALYPALALAQAQATVTAPPDTVVTVAYGSWIASTLKMVSDIALPVVAAVFVWIFRALPAWAVTILKTVQAEQFLAKALTFGLNTVAAAAKDKKLDIQTGNAVVTNAVSYVVEHGPGWLVTWLGGEDGIRDRIIARIPVAEGVSLAPVAAATTVDPTAARAG